eukprot:1558157-Pleurochrysis_carterae.AAC.1
MWRLRQEHHTSHSQEATGYRAAQRGCAGGANRQQCRRSVTSGSDSGQQGGHERSTNDRRIIANTI